ncbi:McrB family protein [Campylobacter sp. CNRCH_2016_0050h]|uniref:McrB family protein n=1 Tax=Campylobacter sp. CNRCH_2016_0050h TaxID=2911608 RepID=UPI0021E6B5A5|nr:AAA family ATPase [Campylobacter sp. CNRCH_2016_0050h]MCV3457288.1 AAA family ATPase [Campylobacter sp. CNRCH_2016_0050h]
MNVVEFHFSNGNKIQAQIENSNEKIFRIFLEKRLKTVNQYINTAKYAIKECKRLNIVNRDDFDTFQINSMEVLINLSFELKDGLLQEYNFKSGKGCPHACINSHYLEFVKYVNAYKNYVSKDMVKYLKTRGGEKEFKVEIKNQKIKVITSADAVGLYSLNRFLEYSVLSKNEDDLYAKPLFGDILSSSNLSVVKQSENEKFYKEHFLKMKKTPNENQNPPLNQILYGPPGTGKTYHTIDKALEILGENLANKDRDEKKAKFDEYVKNRQIVFTTFHQSYGYEEFVEGIKPHIDSKENSKEVEYEIKDGIFKELCKKALDNYENSILNIDELNKKIELKEKVENFLNWLLETNEPIGKTKGGNFFVVDINDKTVMIYSEGVERFDGNFNLSISIFMELLKHKDEFNNAAEMFKKVFDRDYADRTHTYYFNLVKKFKAYEKQSTAKNENKKNNDNSLKPYIIIIDEINRGNVSKIFGELITLIEPSKRIGKEEELKVTLPYSKDEFGVPKNVYIIGTMNTADRSITSLDTALRRRFEFIEMMPKPNVLSDNCEGVNLQELLKAINTRIEYLLDREKTIGHAFFIGIDSLEKLKNVFQNKIIPLLQEYFYNDYALIDAVLNKNGMLEKQDINSGYLKNMTDFIESDKVIYKFSDSQKWDEATFKKIYE